MTRYGMVVDLDRCVGCRACSTACTVHHGLPQGVRWSGVCELTEGVFPDLATMFLRARKVPAPLARTAWCRSIMRSARDAACASRRVLMARASW